MDSPTAAQAVHAVVALPFYLKVLGALGVGAFFWKLVQGNVPTLLAFLQPLALRGVDLFVLAVVAQPVLRWLVIGDKENFLKTVTALLDGLEKISNAVTARLKVDLDAAAAGQVPPALPPPDAPAAPGVTPPPSPPSQEN